MPDEKSRPVLDNKEDTPPEEGIALCLSGGGYRAMMFHAGSLIRLNELGLLGTLKRISSVSGGSITAGVLGMNWNALGLVAGQPSANLDAQVIQPLRKMASVTIDEGAVLGGIFLPGTISDHVADHYAKTLFGMKTLQDLPDEPRFVLNATNVQTGSLMRMSKPYMADYRIGQINQPKLPLARAVAASSAFPPVLSPCEIKLADYGLQFDPAVNSGPLNQNPYNSHLVLTDGGVYDNLGLETAFKRYTTLLVSDGGGHLEAEPDPKSDWARHSYRVLNLVDSQVRALRSRQLIGAYQSGERKGAYWAVRQNVTEYNLADSLACDFTKTTALAATPTRLKAMDSGLQERLMNWGYAICDASLRCYFDKTLPKPANFPYPASGL